MGIIALMPRSAICSCSGVSDVCARAARIRLPTPRARITAFEISRSGTRNLMVLRLMLKRAEHCFQIAQSEHSDDHCYQRERSARECEPDDPEDFPRSHCSSVAALAK